MLHSTAVLLSLIVTLLCCSAIACILYTPLMFCYPCMLYFTFVLLSCYVKSTAVLLFLVCYILIGLSDIHPWLVYSTSVLLSLHVIYTRLLFSWLVGWFIGWLVVYLFVCLFVCSFVCWLLTAFYLGCVVEPYNKHPQLLVDLLNFLRYRKITPAILRKIIL